MAKLFPWITTDSTYDGNLREKCLTEGGVWFGVQEVRSSTVDFMIG